MKIFAPIAVAVTVVMGTAYVAVQQDMRTGADDPQIQLAEDAAAKLATGAAPTDLVSSTTVDIAASLSPWVAVYDVAGNVTVTSGRLDAKSPAVPDGVLVHAREFKQNRVTWQPRPEVRQAIVVVAVRDTSSRVVVAGRSLREVEKRVQQLNVVVLSGWLATLVLSFVAVVTTSRLFRPRSASASTVPR